MRPTVDFVVIVMVPEYPLMLLNVKSEVAESPARTVIEGRLAEMPKSTTLIGTAIE